MDTEAGETVTKKGWRQHWLLGVTGFDVTDPTLKRPHETEWGTHKTPEALWRWVAERARGDRRTVVVAHNLAYDLRISRAMEILPTLGFELQVIRLDGNQAWCRWRKGKTSLVMVDSTSWLPVALARVGEMIGRPKPPLPAAGDSFEDWEHRCRQDCEIMRDAYLRMLRWMEDDDLGVWQMTGAGCAWSAWRHQHLTHKVLAAVNEVQAERERAGAWTGRCEAWKHGRLKRGRWIELDMEMAYATIALQCSVPTKLIAELLRPTTERLHHWANHACVLAEVEVTTDLPLVPADVDGYTVWPVGTFTTTLWSPELRLLFDHGATVRPLRVWGYQAAPALQSWAEWIMPIVQGYGAGVDPIIRLVAKHWSRALIGRFGLRYRQWIEAGESAEPSVQLLPGVNMATGEPFRILQVGHRLYEEGPHEDSPNAVPSIMAYIMSECRRRLWLLMETAGLENVAYVDTDALICSREGAERLQAAGNELPAVILRDKGSWTRVEIHGPRQLVLGDQLRAAGVPKDARQALDGRWEATVWRSLRRSIETGQAGSVDLERRAFVLRGTDRRRRHLAGGQTAPMELLAPAPAPPKRATARRQSA